MTETVSLLAHYGGHHHDGGPGWWIIFPLFWFTLIGLLIFGAIRRRRRWAHYGGGPDGCRPPWAGSSAETVLSERYARGEINEAEYRERLAVLREGGPFQKPQKP